MSVRIGMIWAQGARGEIGRDGTMPWHLPEDLAHFKQTTLGGPVIMGRHTWESLPDRVRPLPGRLNIVVSRTLGFQAEGATVVPTLEGAVALAEEALTGRPVGQGATAWVMGGGQLYAAAMPLAHELVVTQIALEIADADTFAPVIGQEWLRESRGSTLTSSTGLDYTFERYVRPLTGAQRAA